MPLRANLRPLLEQSEQPETQLAVIARVVANVQPSGWVLHAGTTHKVTYSYRVADAPCDVVQVSTSTWPKGDGFTRAEQLSDCTSTARTWYYSIDEGVVYLNLGGPTPSAERAAIGLEMLVGSRGVASDRVGLDKLGGAGQFAAWAINKGVLSPVGWTITATAGGTWEQAAAYAGSYSLRLVATAVAPGLAVQVRRTGAVATVPGAWYRVSGYSLLEPQSSDGLIPVARVVDSGQQYDADGRHLVPLTPGHQVVAGRHGLWRYWEFVLRARGTTLDVDVGLAYTGTGTGTGAVRHDVVRVQRVWRTARVLGRLLGDVVVSSGSSGLAFGGKSTASATITIANTDGAFDFAARQLALDGAWLEIEQLGTAAIPSGSPVSVTTRRLTATPRLAGPQLSDTVLRAAGFIASRTWRRDALVLQVDDIRTHLAGRRAAPNLWPTDLAGSPDQRILGQPRQFLLGEVPDVTPDRYGLTGAGYGAYEVCDCTRWAPGIVDVTEIWCYTDSDAASRRDPTQRVDLMRVAGAVQLTLASGRFEALTAIAPRPLTVAREYYSLKANGTTYHVRLVPGAEQIVHVPPSANGTHTAVTVSGAATAWQAVLSNDAAYTLTNNTTAVCRHTVAVAVCPAASSVPHVFLRVLGARDYSAFDAGIETDTLKLTCRMGGTLYYGSTITAPSSVEAEYDWLIETAPDGSGAWTVAKILAAEWGYEYDPSTSGRRWRCNRIDVEPRLFLATPPTASEPACAIPVTEAQRLQAEIRRVVGNAGISVSYSPGGAADKFRVVADGVLVTTLELLTSTGRQQSGWPALGYRTDQDYTGALSYTGETPVYTAASDADKPVLRATVRGARDDAAGTYTGSPYALIERAPDVLRFVAVVLAGLPETLPDATTFLAARDGARLVALLIKGERTLRDVVDAIERAGLADVVFAPPSEATGGLPVSLLYRPYGYAQERTREVLEGHLYDVTVSAARTAAAARVEVRYGTDQARQGAATATNPDTAILRRLDDALTITTDLRVATEALTAAQGTAALLVAPVIVSGTARRRLAGVQLGERFRLSLARAGLSRALVRTVRAADNLTTGTTAFEALVLP